MSAQAYYQHQRGAPPPPQVPFPWRVNWDPPAGRYLFENPSTGERSFDYPQQHSYQQPGQYGGGYPQASYYGSPPLQRYAAANEYMQTTTEVFEQEAQPQQNPQHHYGKMAMVGAAGLVGGAVLMHEGEKIHEDYKEDKYRVEDDVSRADRWADRKFDDGVQDAGDFPDSATRWTGNEAQRVEDIPDDVAGWAGKKVGNVERFDTGLADSYDQGRDDRRYDDNVRYDVNRRDDYVEEERITVVDDDYSWDDDSKW